jgi:hypothetical protein
LPVAGGGLVSAPSAAGSAVSGEQAISCGIEVGAAGPCHAGAGPRASAQDRDRGDQRRQALARLLALAFEVGHHAGRGERDQGPEQGDQGEEVAEQHHLVELGVGDHAGEQIEEPHAARARHRAEDMQRAQERQHARRVPRVHGRRGRGMVGLEQAEHDGRHDGGEDQRHRPAEAAAVEEADRRDFVEVDGSARDGEQVAVGAGDPGAIVGGGLVRALELFARELDVVEDAVGDVGGALVLDEIIEQGGCLVDVGDELLRELPFPAPGRSAVPARARCPIRTLLFLPVPGAGPWLFCCGKG